MKSNKKPNLHRDTESATSFFGKWAESGKDAGMEEHHSESVNFMIDKISKNSNSGFNFIDAGCGNGWVWVGKGGNGREMEGREKGKGRMGMGRKVNWI